MIIKDKKSELQLYPYYKTYFETFMNTSHSPAFGLFYRYREVNFYK